MKLSYKDEKEYIKKYNQGMTRYEASQIYGKSIRTIGDYESNLRKKGLIKLRKEISYDIPIVNNLPISIGSKNSKRIVKLENLTSEEIKNIKEQMSVKWKIPKSTRTINKKKFKTYLVTADYHVPYQNNNVVNILLQIVHDIKFDGFLIVGDMMNMTPISHWLRGRNKRKSLEGKRLQEDYIIGNKLLDEFDKLLPKNCDKRFWWGNHEIWYSVFIEEYPQLEGLFNPSIELHLKERGYKVYEEENHIERIGKLSITHGMYTGVNFLRKHLQEFKTNVLIGHLHQMRMRFDPSPAKELATAGYSIGCVCDMNPDYMQNRPHSWTHGFAVVKFWNDGFFNVDLVRIIGNKCIYNDKEYKSKI